MVAERGWMEERGGKSDVIFFQLKTYFNKRKKFRGKDKTKRSGGKHVQASQMIRHRSCDLVTLTSFFQ